MEETKKLIKIAIRELTEFCLKSGDLTSGFNDPGRMAEGIAAHKEIQNAAGDDYKAEITVSHTIEISNAIFEINGRMDGLIDQNGIITIDEIKTLAGGYETTDENSNPEHWGQAKCYAYIYGIQNNISELNVRLTYYCQKTKQIKYFIQNYNIAELEKFVVSLLETYHKRILAIENWHKI